jgi:CIC family chloride channel protein
MQTHKAKLFNKKSTSDFYNFLLTFFQKMKMNEHSFMLIMAVIIGVIGGYASVAIHWMIHFFQKLLWGGEFNLSLLNSIEWYYKLIIPIIGGIVVGLVIRYVAKEAKGHGVPEVMEAITLRNGVIRARVAFAKLFSSAFYIASGGSVGREGPVIQIGSAVGSAVGQFLKVNPKRMKTFVACGAASGIAAAFNAPVAGALFAVEIILGDFAVAQFSPIVISSVTATIISRHYHGDFPAFVTPSYQLVSPFEIFNYIILGFLAGLVALAFIKTLYLSEDIADKINLPDWLKGAAGGLMIGFIGLFAPEIFGVGYDTMASALSGTLVWKTALLLVFIKILATSISLGSGGSGGIFAPSLFIGAMLGAFYGNVAHQIFPDWTAEAGAYALVAMGGVVGAATHGPIAAILIIFEMTNDYKIILPLMVTTIIATMLASRMQKESIYTLKLVRRGINIFGGKEINVLKSIKVATVKKRRIDPLPETASFHKVLEKMMSSNHNCVYVKDQNEKICGFICMQELRQTLMDYDHLKHLLIAKDILNPQIQLIKNTDNLDYVMKQFGKYEQDELAVISEENGYEIMGAVWKSDIIAAYNQQIFIRDMSGESQQSIRHLTTERKVQVIGDYHFSEKETPAIFVGKSLSEIGLRIHYNVELLLVRRNSITKDGSKSSDFQYLQPDGSSVLQAHDTLLIFGELTALDKFDKL